MNHSTDPSRPAQMGAAHSSEAKDKGRSRRRGLQVKRSDAAWSAGEWHLDQGLVGEVLCGETACMQSVEAPEGERL